MGVNSWIPPKGFHPADVCWGQRRKLAPPDLAEEEEPLSKGTSFSGADGDEGSARHLPTVSVNVGTGQPTPLGSQGGHLLLDVRRSEAPASSGML